MLKVEFIGGEELVKQFQNMDVEIHASLLKTITLLSIKLQSYVQTQKLSGQVLKTKTGTLRRSISQEVIDTPSKISGRVGTNVDYGIAWELGFKGVVNVKEHLRSMKKAFGKPIKPIKVTVSPHSRFVNMEERSFLRSALRDMLPEIEREIDKVVKDYGKKS